MPAACDTLMARDRSPNGETRTGTMTEPDPATCVLADRECVPCRGGVPPLEGAELERLSGELGDDWTVVDGRKLERRFKLPDFKAALDLTNRIGQLAESAGHHPDIHLGWGKVTVILWTHKIKGLAEADFVMAAKIDRLVSG
jgi:4a-hydroxytetrahydrobiopterin dehydratase